VKNASGPEDCPLLTVDLPGTGGSLETPEDFVVEEIPAYLPGGSGEHCMALLEKRGLTTPQALQRICQALDLPRDGAGYAGLKDKFGVTRQWVSFFRARPADLLRVQEPDLRVLEAGLHRNKVHTGHLRGNRFVVTLRGTGEEALPRAERILARLVAEGMPNFYGAQRFGRQGDNAALGLRLLRGEAPPPRDRVQRRLLVSSLQSLLFNEVLARRLATPGAGLRHLLGGEVLQRTDSSGLFVSEDRETDAARLARGEVMVTGPICGPRMPLPLEGSPARELEESVFAGHDVTPQSFAALGRLARGGRRPISVALPDAGVETLPESPGLVLRFTLPPGAYATVLLREVVKGEPGVCQAIPGQSSHQY
jgi:tRNA pseudouridine13 synthase